jgi:uncharacterized membrane protein
VKNLYICGLRFLSAALFNTREGVNMKDILLGGLLGFVIAVVVIASYGFRIGVYTL